VAVIGEDFSAVLSAAQRGDEVAYSRLWRDANPPLLRYLRVVTSGDPDDIAAETWASIVRGLRRFRGDESGWRAWLFATARRRAIDDGRRRSRERDIPVDDISDLVPLEALVQPSGDPADLVLAQLALDEALQAIRGLPPLQAEVLVLRIVAGLSTETVAALTGSTPGAVRVAAHRGLKRLAGQFTPAGAARV
jgi:RNA polymerase sigma-70 factor (ECF subfamily)